MKSRLIQRLTSFLDQRSHNWQQRLCLVTFLMLSLSVILPGVPMHIVGLIGRSDTPLHIMSALLWGATIVVLVLYLLHRMPLKAAISIFGILVQLTGSARIVYITVERPVGYEDAVLFNHIISLALIIYLVLAAVRHMPTVIALMSIGTIVFAYLYTDGGVNRQIVVSPGGHIPHHQLGGTTCL